MKQEVGRIKDKIAGGIKARLDALTPEQRLHVVIGMFGILVVLFLYCQSHHRGWETGLFTT